MAIKILQGDCVEKMRELPDECVHCVVTSPPYYGLRSYLSADDPNKGNEIGAEQTPEQYVARMVEVFREVRRVLRNDGTLWLNLGDSYAADRGGSGMPAETMSGGKNGHGNTETLRGRGERSAGNPRRNCRVYGFKHKDLILIPHTVAAALRADGWYLRAAIPWIKRNGMPESVRDRPSQVIEYIFMLTKSQRCYYDAEAVKMPLSASFANDKRHQTGSSAANEKDYPEGVQNPKKLHKMFDKEKPNGRVRRTRDWFIESWQGLLTDEDGDPLAFVVNTVNYKGSHFATFPPKLIEPCILASTSAHGCCSKCEAPWERIVGRPCKACNGFIPTQGKSCPSCGYINDWKAERGISAELVADNWSCPGKSTPRKLNESGKQGSVPPQEVLNLGWKATCDCNAEVEPCVVLDPFLGSGTTAQVAQQHGRNAVGIELNASYIPLIEQRTGVAA